jgi:hypothetical protein
MVGPNRELCLPGLSFVRKTDILGSGQSWIAALAAPHPSTMVRSSTTPSLCELLAVLGILIFALKATPLS